MKRAIRYLRFSNLGQSNGSIERQEIVTDQWLSFNQVGLVDTFIDRGHTARNFDRPDFIKLRDFIKKHHRYVDYLVVDQLDRFSRIAGEALTLVKALQDEYGIQIVSVTENITFDYETPGSYFRTGLQLLLAEEDNINRSIKVRSGLYAAKAKEGRFVYKNAPFGYRKTGERKDRTILVEESEAKIVRYIFDAYLRDVPLNIIKIKAKELGFDRGGNMAIERVLANPAYAGLLFTKSFKELPGGLFPARHEGIVDKLTWQMVQAKMKKPEKPKICADESIPLRGILKCHCGNPVTGAPSRGKSGKYFYYYKCKHSGHNNISAIKAHDQLLGAFELMSLPINQIKDIKVLSEKRISEELSENKSTLATKKRELAKEEELLFAVEEKWIKGLIEKDTYNRWYSNYSTSIITLKGTIERIGKDQNTVFGLMNRNIDKLSDLKYIYSKSDMFKKQEIVKLVFDSNLYYQNGIYRTPTMLNLLSHNYLIMKEKGYLIYEKKRDDFSIIPSSGL
jgi:DNA invertase Pin-like site-specific DNA recombinase